MSGHREIFSCNFWKQIKEKYIGNKSLKQKHEAFFLIEEFLLFLKINLTLTVSLQSQLFIYLMKAGIISGYKTS